MRPGVTNLWLNETILKHLYEDGKIGFEFVSPEPKVGSNLAGKSLKMTTFYFGGGSQEKCSFKSGKLTVREFGDWTMTVRFENLRMEGTDENGKKVSYTFNGVATTPFQKFFD